MSRRKTPAETRAAELAAADRCEVSIFARAWEAAGPLPAEVARHVLALHFPQRDVDRIHELAVRNGEGGINPEELAEYDEYLRVSWLLSILHSKARVALGVEPERRETRANPSPPAAVSDSPGRRR